MTREYRRPGREAGFTLVEVMVTIALAGVLMGLAVAGWQGWSRAAAQEGLVLDLRGALRMAQQQAVTEGSSTCVRFDVAAETWSRFRGRCDDPGAQLVEGPVAVGDGLGLDDARFQHDSTTYLPGVTFTPRGTATPGGVTVTRESSDVRVRIRVEALTSRVSSS